MTDSETANAALVREYLLALENGECGNRLARFFAPDALQIEFPNLLNPKGGESDLGRIFARSIEGQKILRGQQFTIRSQVVQDSRVAVEAEWTAVPAVDAGPLRADTPLRAHFAMFFDFVDGRIHRQRNYDCFDGG